MKEQVKRNIFLTGMKDAIPVGAGYFAVSFSLGMMAKRCGLTPLAGFISSLINHASAGEYAELTVIKSASSLLEMAIIIFITNLRYSLMSLSYSQRFDPNTKLGHRILMCFGITDEIYALNISRPGYLSPTYTYGAMTLAIPLWSLGTAIGISIGNILPEEIVAALSISLYGMFIAIIIPPAKKDRILALCICVSFAISYAASKLPITAKWSEGSRVIVLTIVLSALAALIFPRKEVCS